MENMDRKTMKTLATSLGGMVLDSSVKTIHFAFKTEEALFKFREQIPFVNIWQSNHGWQKPIEILVVHLDKIKDY